MNVCAILTCHNRRPTTLECLRSYFSQSGDDERTAVVVDDGSGDGTGRAVQEHFPRATVVVGDGTLYWARGMALAEKVAIAQRPDYMLWLNDDVVLDSDALPRLISISREVGDDCIIVGALRDPVSCELTYSGVRRCGRHPLRMARVGPVQTPVAVDTFNGNVVLVPVRAARKFGPIDGALVHAAADLDYGLRAADAGVLSLLAPRWVGSCALNTATKPWLDLAVKRRQRLGLLLGPKGLPPRPRARYLTRHGGPAWFLFWLAPYVRAAPSIVRPYIPESAEG